MIIIWLGMFLIAFIQVPVLINKSQWKELAFFTVLWIIAGVYASLILGTFTGRITIINHTELIRRVISTFHKKLSL